MSTYVDLPDVNWRLSARGVVYRPNIEKGIECYVYYEFSSGWSQADAHNAENIMSRTGYVITCTGFKVLWCSKLLIEPILSKS